MGHIHIGTSGWHYKHWRGPFYPENLPQDKWLRYYFERLSSVEINNSFYRLPRAETVINWREQTPPNFVFAAKAWRLITHLKRLKDTQAALEAFFTCIENFQGKLGPILFQLPPHWNCNVERLHAFLDGLPKKHRYTFEFRNANWHLPEIYSMLEHHRATFCIYQLAGFTSPLISTADFVYVRLHGPAEKKYEGDYPIETLHAWAERARSWLRQGKEVYIYFDNDQAGYAVKNAITLQEMTVAKKSGAHVL